MSRERKPIKVTFRPISLISICSAMLAAIALLGWQLRADAIVDLSASLAYASYYANALPFEVKLANGTLKTLVFLAIDPIARHLRMAAFVERCDRLVATVLGGALCRRT